MSPIKNVIFIMLDTLQFNYLRCTNVKHERQNACSRIWIVLSADMTGVFLFENACRHQPRRHRLCQVEAAGSE